MPRTTIPSSAAPGSYTHVGAVVTMTAGEANNNQVLFQDGLLVVVRNSGVVDRVMTIVSANDAIGRTKDITETMAAGQVRMFGPFFGIGWRQSDGYLYLNPAHADLLIGVISFPR